MSHPFKKTEFLFFRLRNVGNSVKKNSIERERKKKKVTFNAVMKELANTDKFFLVIPLF